MLFTGGRFTPFQCTLWSLPIYYMPLFKILASVASRPEKIIRDLLWPKHDIDNGFHQVSWDEIYRPKEDSDLPIRPLRAMNEVLKTQWLQRYVIEDDALWKKVIVSKFGADSLG